MDYEPSPARCTAVAGGMGRLATYSTHNFPPYSAKHEEASTVALTLSTHCAVVAAICWFRLAAYFGGRELSRLNSLQESFHLCLELRLHATQLVWKVLLHNVNGCLFTCRDTVETKLLERQ